MMDGKKAVLPAFLVMLLFGAALLAVNEVPLPAGWRDAAARQLSGALGLSVSVGSVGVGVGGVTMHEVTIDGPWPLRVERIAFGWSLREMARTRDPLAALRFVELSGLEAPLSDEVWGRLAVTSTGTTSGTAASPSSGASDAVSQPTGWQAVLARWPAETEIEVRLRDGRLAGPDAVVNGSGVLRSGSLSMRLEVRRRDEHLVAEGELSLADGALALTLDAVDMAVADYVPALSHWNIGGRADFFGSVTGSLTDPVLQGTLASDGGRLFGQPYTSLQGDVTLDRRGFAFARAEVVQGTSVYFLDGRIGFGAAEPGRAAELELALRTDRGRAETLLSALGWDVPVQAALAGTLTFRGPVGSVAASGDVQLTHGTAYGQSFDGLTGRFRYADGQFAIDEAVASLRGGVIRLRGGGPVDGRWEVAVAGENVPLQAVQLVRERLPQASGLVGFDGVVFGGARGGTPGARGRVSGRYVALGDMAFEQAEGSVAYDGDWLAVESLSLRRQRGGTYTVTGRVHAADDASLDLSIAVEDESLGDVLTLLGATPMLAASGPVSAAAWLTGTLSEPSALVEIDARDVTVVGRRLGIGLTLRWHDGRVDVQQWERVGRGGAPAAGADDGAAAAADDGAAAAS